MEHVIEGCQCEGKRCTKCDRVRCTGHYTKDKRLRSGLQARCRDCSKAQYANWRENNREYDAKRHQVYRAAHREEQREKDRQYKLKNADQIRAKRKKYYQENQEMLRAKSLQFHYERPDVRQRRRQQPEVKAKESEAWKRYYYENKERMSERGRNYRQAYPEVHARHQLIRRTRKTQAGGSYTIQEWEALKAQYNYQCLCCGKQEPDITLTADHIVPVSKGGTSHIENIQPLCKPCNSRKHAKTIDYRNAS